MSAHAVCTLTKPCTLPGCPAGAAAEKRRRAEAARWDGLTVVYGRYYLGVRALWAGDKIELQAAETEVDDFGHYTRPLDAVGSLVTFGFEFNKPVISGEFAGTRFSTQVHDGMGFRWPAPKAPTAESPSDWAEARLVAEELKAAAYPSVAGVGHLAALVLALDPDAIRRSIAAGIRERYGAADPGSAAAEPGARIVWLEIADLIERGQL